MPIALSAEHDDLRRTVRRWLDAHCPPAVPRAALEPDADPATLPDVWADLAAQGWLGLHLDEDCGGEGFGLVELAVVLEEFGRAVVPGPVLPTVLASALIQRAGDDAIRHELLPGLADGSTPAAVAFGAGRLTGTEAADGTLHVSGTLRPVLGAPQARLLVAPAEPGGWFVLDLAAASGSSVTALAAVDPTRPLGQVTVEAVAVAPTYRLAGLDGPGGQLVADLSVALAAAEAAGGAAWCIDTAAAHATTRVQFGRPIGQFQAVKHKLADMLVEQSQLVAVAWDAARALERHDLDRDVASLTAAVAGSLAADAFFGCAKDCIQILGGIGFTWEHDAHLYLKRALAARQLFGDPDAHRHRVADLAAAGTRRTLSTELPAGAQALRAELAPVVDRAAALEGDVQRAFLCDAGLLVPHWPAPFGRDAGAVEQLVIDALLSEAGIARPHLGVGAWALPTLVAHGTPDQQARWVRPTLLGQLNWCQLFSEPGAGSDLASLSMKAGRDEAAGGWRLTGQKVWTSMAQFAHWGICLARTDPDVPKHDGISYFVVDMASAGLDIRPLRELTGAAMFNEVFFDDVFVPDDCLIGAPGDGWRIGRTTLANERVSISSGSTFGTGVESVLRRFARLRDGAVGPGGADGLPDDGGPWSPRPDLAALRLGALLAEAQSLHLMGEQALLRSLSGLEPGAGASVRKLLGAEHEQRVQEAGLALYGPEGAVAEGSPARWNMGLLATRCLTIAGGTSEVQRNVIAERLLGLPKDPEPGH